MGELQRHQPGLRPVGFWSPYEAAAWAILSHRVRIVQAARIKQRLAEQYGTQIELDGRQRCAFPAPHVPRELRSFEGIAERKLPWLRATADAAIEGELDGGRLRSPEPSEALDQLRDLPGIGPFGVEVILIERGHPPRPVPYPRAPTARGDRPRLQAGRPVTGQAAARRRRLATLPQLGCVAFAHPSEGRNGGDSHRPTCTTITPSTKPSATTTNETSDWGN